MVFAEDSIKSIPTKALEILQKIVKKMRILGAYYHGRKIRQPLVASDVRRRRPDNSIHQSPLPAAQLITIPPAARLPLRKRLSNRACSNGRRSTFRPA